MLLDEVVDYCYSINCPLIETSAKVYKNMQTGSILCIFIGNYANHSLILLRINMHA